MPQHISQFNNKDDMALICLKDWVLLFLNYQKYANQLQVTQL